MAGTSDAFSDKSKKYDRQLRLWGDHGQTTLEDARVCLLNATATGTETLKNVVLPGCGSFVVVDGEKVTEEDVGSNFFMQKDWIGKSRAECATALLLELNSDVTGNYLDETPHRILENRPEFFSSFSCVVATGLEEKTLLLLDKVLCDYGIPLIIVRVYGFIGYMRIVVSEHTVIESHPDNTHPDLRLDRPFDQLQKYTDSMDLSAMNKQDHGHTPFVVLLLKYLDKWRATHDGAVPKSYKEKKEFKQLVKTGILCNEDGVPEVEENFDEADKSVNSSLVPTKVPSEVQSIFCDDKCINITKESSLFWILARAVKDFVENEGEGALPLRGSLPDMTADSARYIKLLQAYQEKAKQDAEMVTRRVQQLLKEVGKAEYSISGDEIMMFCKNSRFLRVVRCRALSEEYNVSTAKREELGMHLEMADDLVYYVLLRAAERFRDEHQRLPGVIDDQLMSDVTALKSCTTAFLQELGITTAVSHDCIHEMCRFGGSELHTMAACLGGMAGQEVIKLVTHQFVPFNNTFIYNGMTCSSVSVEL
ncbi:NEDD8-activating enzyme E1 regulatory subunit-like [Corticium candelabrum]|uniref:NEDD8-activating enzyme E1 regulatory subunit-like n=1 Tax=Corticium candelabrum TaxID=121492 RepID=UPI002E2608F2|nr:NEDD8-activating enzyme E1 regulatory subunit-like [Corticium candelabrum]